MYPLHGEMQTRDAIARELLGEGCDRTDIRADDECDHTDVTVDVPSRVEKPSFLTDRESDADCDMDVDIVTGGAE